MAHTFVDHQINQTYRDYVQPLNQNIYEILNSRAKSLGFNLKNCRILDFGCNVGHLASLCPYSLSSDQYVGIDISANALAIAEEKHPHLSWRHYNKFQNTFNPMGDKKAQIPLEPQERFDIIFCYGVFTHFFMCEIEETVSTLQKYLNPGGALFFSVWEDVDFYGYLGFLDRCLNINVQIPKPKAFQQGFVMVDRKRLLIDMSEPDADSYLWVESFYRPDYINSVFPTAVRLEGHYSKHPVYVIKNSIS